MIPSTQPLSPLRQRMLEDMRMRKLRLAGSTGVKRRWQKRFRRLPPLQRPPGHRCSAARRSVLHGPTAVGLQMHWPRRLAHLRLPLQSVRLLVLRSAPSRPN